jgi:hypothetical protein
MKWRKAKNFNSNLGAMLSSSSSTQSSLRTPLIQADGQESEDRHHSDSEYAAGASSGGRVNGRTNGHKYSISLNKDRDSAGSGDDNIGVVSKNTEKPLGLIDKGSAAETKGRIYANNKPRIILEILSARSALIILALTYIIFAIGFTIDAVDLTRAFHNSNQYLYSMPCSDLNIGPSNYTTDKSWGCLDGSRWNATVVGLSNIISVQLNVEQKNFSGLFNYSQDSASVPKAINYDIYLYACFESNGCGNTGDSFTDSTSSSQMFNKWSQVVYLSNQEIKVYQHDLNEENYATNGFSMTVLQNTFQNQESIPDKGAVQSYFFTVQYYYVDGDTAKNLLVSSDNDVLSSIQYSILIVDRPSHGGGEVAVVIILMIFTLASLVYFIQKTFVEQTKKTLPEQRWVVVYLIVVFIFQNIIYCSIYWQKSPTFSIVYASYVLDAFGQAGLFIVWLLFSDSIRRKAQNFLVFYVPKIFFGFCIFLVNLVVLTYQFPSIVPYGPEAQRSSVESFSNWPKEAERAFVAFSTMYVLLLWIFVIRWFYLLWLTGRELRQLPYMGTRYLQLSYRFFLLQATLVTLFYMFEYGYILVSIANNATSNNVTITDLANDVNTLLREQTQLFGKILFLSVYAFILAFIFLPANVVEQHQHDGGLAANLAATYVISVDELKPLVKARRHSIKHMNKLQKSVFEKIVSYKAEVFCADLALTMCNLSMEAYYDVEGKPTTSGFGHAEDVEKFIETEKYGYALLDSTYNEDHDTFCAVLRHIKTKHLVVMFRYVVNCS